MELDDLALFVDVARAGSFALVARDRGVDPSSVSRSIAGLEAALGTRLFQRTTRSMVLTETGALYLTRLPRLMDELARLRDDAVAARIEAVGTVRLTTSVTFGQACLTPLLPAIAERFPRLALELILTDANLDLITDRIDLAVRFGESPRLDVVGEKLFSTHYRVVASRAYLARAGRLDRPDDLASRDCLLFALPNFRSRWLFRTDLGDEAVTVRGRFVVSNAAALRQAALDGLGPALLADWLIDKDIAAGRLDDIFPAYRVTATGFDTAAWLLYASREYLPRKTRAMLEFLRTSFSSRV